MTLQAKLNSLQASQIVSEIDTMLNDATVTISWWGQRLVTIKGYEGSVVIDDLTQKYLQSNVFPNHLTAAQESELPTLEERLKCYDLWDKVKDLYTKSDTVLKATWVFWLVVWIREINPSVYPGMDMQSVIRSDDLTDIELSGGAGRRNACFEFPTEMFKRLFPNKNPVFAYLTHLKQGKFKHEPHAHFEHPSGPFVDEKQLEKITVVITYRFKDLCGTFIKKETFTHFFPGEKFSEQEPYHQNNCVKLVEWLVTTKNVVEHAIKA